MWSCTDDKEKGITDFTQGTSEDQHAARHRTFSFEFASAKGLHGSSANLCSSWTSVTAMKPSDRIAEIKDELVNEDWVSFAGNTFSREAWRDLCRDDAKYWVLSICKFLNEKFPE